MTDRTGVIALREAGRRLWKDVNRSSKLDEAGKVLLLEACRLTDRLDRMAKLIDGSADDWLTIVGKENEQVLVINNLMSEARQHAATLSRLMAELEKRTPKANHPPQEVPIGVIDLVKRVASKRAQTAG